MNKLTIVALLAVYFAAINAQNVDQYKDYGDPTPVPTTRPNYFRRRLPVFNRNPVNNFAKRVGEGVRGGTNRFRSSLQNIVSEVKNRTDLAENRFKEQIKELRTHAIDTLSRLNTLDKQVLQLEKYLKEVNQTFLDSKRILKTEITNQKTIIDKHIESAGTDGNAGDKSKELEEESNRLDKKLTEVDNLKLVPQQRGLGDGFGRHLK